MAAISVTERWTAPGGLARVALLRPPIQRRRLYHWYGPLASREAPLGLLYLASYLADLGHQVAIWDGEQLGREELLGRLHGWKPEVVGVTTTTFSFIQAARLIQEIRRLLPAALLLAGGAHVSALPADTLERVPALDGCVVGEGEETLREIVSGQPVQNIAGLVWRDGEGVIQRNAPRPGLRDLDRYRLHWDRLEGFPERFQPPWQSRRHSRAVGLVASRGCTFACSFCAGATVHGRARRAHSPEYVVKLMHGLRRTHGATTFYFHDDNFTLDAVWLQEFCERLLAGAVPLRWACASRVEPLHNALLRTMHQAGCFQVGVGVESGSEKVLCRLGKGTTPGLLEDGLRRIHAAGIETKAYLIVGTPGETLADLRATLALVRRLPLEHVQVVYYTPLPGSPDGAAYPRGAQHWSQMNLLTPLPVGSLPLCCLRTVELSAYALVYGRRAVRSLGRRLTNLKALHR